MTTTVQTPTAAVAELPAGSSGPRRAMVALARTEGVRLLRHPVTIAAVLLWLGPWGYDWITGDANRYPVLHDEDRGMQFFTMLLLGGAALVAGNLAVLRAHRHGTTSLYDVLLLPVAWRTGAHLLATLAMGLLTAALVAVRGTALAVLPGAAGRLDPYELAANPVAVVLLGAVGVLLARLVRSVIVAPLVVLCLGLLTFAYAAPDAGWPPWFLPVALVADPLPLPAELMARPAAAHLVYLAGLLLLVAVAALARSGVRGPRLLVVGTVALAIIVGAGVVQVRPVSPAVVAARITATARPAEQQTCRAVDQITYCAFPDFVPWVDGWDTVVRGVLRRVPPAEARRPFGVRQRVWAHDYPHGGSVSSSEERAARGAAWRRDDQAAGTPNTVTVGTQWGDGRAEVAFAGLVAYEVLGRKGAGVDGPLCGARGVLVGWLAGQATPATTAGLRDLDSTSTGGVGFVEPSFMLGLVVPDREMAVVHELLRRPADEVAAVVLRSWAELTAQKTPAERVGELFGVPVPPAPPASDQTTCTL